MSYFNTTHVRGQELVGYKIQAKRQEDRVLEFAQHNPGAEFSAEDAVRLFLPATPITSARRCLTNLERAGKLVRLSKQVEGSWGRPIYLYRLAPPPIPDREPRQERLL